MSTESPVVDSAVEERISRGTLDAHLATSVDDRPHVAPVWFTHDEGVVRVVTGGQKLANVRRNPRVALSIEETCDGDALWMVSMRGTAHVVDDADRIGEAAERIFSRYLGDDVTQWDDYYRQQLDAPDGALLEIRIGSASFEAYEPADEGRAPN